MSDRPEAPSDGGVDEEQHPAPAAAPSGAGTATAAGFRSDRSRRRLVRLAWLLGVVAFVLQLSLPVILLVTGVIVMVGEALSMPSAHVRGAALHDGRIWFAMPIGPAAAADEPRSPGSDDEPPATPTGSTQRWRLESVDAGGSASSGAVSAAPVTLASPTLFDFAGGLLDRPHLLSAGGHLLVVGRRAVGTLEDQAIRWRQARAPLARLRAPLWYQGQLAVPRLVHHAGSSQSATLALDTWAHGHWAQRYNLELELPEKADVRQLRILPGATSLHVFVETLDDELIHRALTVEGVSSGHWSQPLQEPGEWSSALVAGDPAVFRLVQRERATTVAAEAEWSVHLLGAVRNGDDWREMAEVPIDRGREVNALSHADGSAWLVTDGRYGGIDVRRFAAGRFDSPGAHPGPFPYRLSVMLLVSSQLAPLLLTMVVALLLARAMRHHRVLERLVGTTSVRYASLVRRGVAEGIDMVVYLVGPAAVLGPQIAQTPEAFSNALVLFVCVLWCLPVMLVLSYLEGRFGRTPGKWLTGIRVVGLDLQPCGFNRALIRNLMQMIDGILHFLVGILVVTLSRDWQRLGDRAARTIVIRTRP